MVAEKGFEVPGRISVPSDRPATQTRSISVRIGPSSSAVREAPAAGVKGTKFFKHILSSALVPPPAHGSGSVLDCDDDDDLRLLDSQNEMSDWKLPFSLYPLDDQMRQQATEDNAAGKKFDEGPYPIDGEEADDGYHGKKNNTKPYYFHHRIYNQNIILLVLLVLVVLLLHLLLLLPPPPPPPLL